MLINKSPSAVDYVSNGWALVPIPAGLKGPSGPGTTGWNRRENCVTDAAIAGRLPGNYGLAHAYSGTAAIDIDDLDRASAYLSGHGIDLHALLSAADAVRISSGRPNRAKLLYRMVTPLASKKIVDGKENIIDFRCATSELRTVQDVVPPSVHPDTGKPYVWEYGDDLIGDWRQLPYIPDALLNLWRFLVSDSHGDESSQFANRERVSLERLRELVMAKDPDCSREDWVRVLAAIHYETQGSEEGFALANEWSSASKNGKYKGSSELRTVWRSFKLGGERMVTAASLGPVCEASADDIEDISVEVMNDVEIAVGTLPAAQRLCTDQANAQRISRAFGHKLVVCTGRFYKWTGTHWVADDGEAQRCAANLSAIVSREAKRAREKADKAFAALDPEIVQAAAEHPRKNALDKTEKGASAMELLARADALDKWVNQCEFKSVQDAAIGLLRKLLTIEAVQLDRDPWALNCLSGTIDLRTGVLRPHNAKDFITRIAPVEYDSKAPTVRFTEFVSSIMAGDSHRAAFLQRWFGYCATGDVREQKLVCHIGAGANGKGTLLNAIQDVLGEYVGTAAPNLLTSSLGASDRHPTEIANLFGKRMVTAHETDDAAVLREGFVKQATGGDRLVGRFMRADFFEFSPTHKLQLLTNHRPTIKGQDYGIWRRILLVPYTVRFGTAEDIQAGRADALRNDGLADVLRVERAGILKWIVEGAVLWHRDGLQPPDSVLAASREYQREQDRLTQFIGECCVLGQDQWAPYSGACGLYPRYQSWCKESGYFGVGKGRFVADLERVVPFFRKEDRKIGSGAARRKINGCIGISVLNEGFEDLL